MKILKWHLALVYIFCCFAFGTCAAVAEYRITPLCGLSSTKSYCETRSINDKGQVIGSYAEIENGKYTGTTKIFLFDREQGFISICIPKQNLSPYSFNNQGQVICYDSGTQKCFIWDTKLGISHFNPFNAHYCFIRSLNNSGKMLGFYRQTPTDAFRSFLVDNGVITDLGIGSDFSYNSEFLGYHMMDLNVCAINDKNQLIGTFSYGKLHPTKNKYVKVGTISFFWDGKIHFLPENISAFGLNNKGLVLARKAPPLFGWSDETYLWDLEGGLRYLPGFIGWAINDSSVVLGEKDEEVVDHSGMVVKNPAIWREGAIITLADLLGVESIYSLAPPYSDSYSIEALSKVAYSINSKGQITCMGIIWGDSYPVILEPVNTPLD